MAAAVPRGDTGCMPSIHHQRRSPSRVAVVCAPFARILPAVAVVLVLATIGFSDEPARDGGFAALSTLRSMTPDQLAARPRVRVRGTITQRMGYWFIVQDATGGIRVDFQQARDEGVWNGDKDGPAEGAVGRGMEVEGIVAQGEIAPTVLPIAARVLGPEPLPPARPVDG